MDSHYPRRDPGSDAWLLARPFVPPLRTAALVRRACAAGSSEPPALRFEHWAARATNGQAYQRFDARCPTTEPRGRYHGRGGFGLGSCSPIVSDLAPSISLISGQRPTTPGAPYCAALGRDIRPGQATDASRRDGKGRASELCMRTFALRKRVLPALPPAKRSVR